ncbi:MAG TPA: CocE/NonD family hydrolase [Thermomicrobiaceae bacterium]|nr:CocE/NonD family hydrolase [Thermomicrobiaceae bacterium]
MPLDDNLFPLLPTSTISERLASSTHIQHDLRVPLRDGVELSLDLIRPDTPGAYPVVLLRTPYDKTQSRTPFLHELARRGYIVALNDLRGRFNSDGEFTPYIHDTDDGYDVVEWLASQEWCDGNVGMAGGSCVARTQWLAAAANPPHLRAIVPVVSPPDAYLNEPITHGCFLLPVSEWMLWMGRRSWQLTDAEPIYTQLQPYFNTLPLADVARAAGIQSRWWDEWMQHPNLDAYWKRGSYMHAWGQMSVAALNISGWWDMNFPGAHLNFSGMRAHARSDVLRTGQKLIIGPWPHRVNRTRTLNGLDFGEQAIINLEQYQLRFYDRWLKGVDNGIDAEPPVYVFVLGANEWWAESDWPPPDAEEVPFYLHSRGHANRLTGDGGLSTEPPGEEPADAYRYDPRDPNGMLWRIADGPVDDRLPAIRDDMLCYTSEVLDESLTVVGPVSVTLYAASSARDTDWHVRLCDVHPDGSARFLCHGMLRARFRESFEQPRLLKPGEVYAFTFGADACGVRFLPGHRIRVEVTSSWFPEYDRNTNAGAENNFLDAQVVVATNRIFHERGRASHVTLPVVRR